MLSITLVVLLMRFPNMYIFWVQANWHVLNWSKAHALCWLYKMLNGKPYNGKAL